MRRKKRGKNQDIQKKTTAPPPCLSVEPTKYDKARPIIRPTGFDHEESKKSITEGIQF
jgi:hypothetical protein